MLEFEDEKRPMKAEVTAPTGFVVVPIEQYNELLLAAEAAQTPLKVRRQIWTGHDELEVLIDSDWLLSVGVQMAKQKYSDEELAAYTFVKPDDIYSPTVTIAKLKPQELVEPEPF